MTLRIDADHHGALDVTADTVIGADASVTGQVTVSAGATLRISGQVTGDVVVHGGAALVLIGRVKGVVRNQGGDVDVFGFAGHVVDSGATETMVSRGAIIAGQRSALPVRLSRFLAAHPGAARRD